jgi:hypothetical protein
MEWMEKVSDEQYHGRSRSEEGRIEKSLEKPAKISRSYEFVQLLMSRLQPAALVDRG